MEEQRKSEMRWYAERQALKKMQASRSQSSAQAQSILRSLGNAPSTDAPTAVGDATHAEAELTAFDRGLYEQQTELEHSMTAELKVLGVPFFGTDPALIKQTSHTAPAGPEVLGRPKWSPLVTDPELLELRKRMIGHLEDLYRD